MGEHQDDLSFPKHTLAISIPYFFTKVHIILLIYTPGWLPFYISKAFPPANLDYRHQIILSIVWVFSPFIPSIGIHLILNMLR